MVSVTVRTNRTNRTFVRSVRTTHTTPFKGVCFVREFVCEGLSLERGVKWA